MRRNVCKTTTHHTRSKKTPDNLRHPTIIAPAGNGELARWAGSYNSI
jgi:hypothetical protein